VPEITVEGEIRMRTSSMEVIGIGVRDLLDANRAACSRRR
jgi:hypothetical protein